jgi:hypothetical protein
MALLEQEAQGPGAQLTLTGSRQGKKPDVLKYVYVFLILHRSRFMVEYRNFQN